MGARGWHVSRAEHAKRAADHLARDQQFEDWAGVALFYSAMHYVHSSPADEPGLLKDERHARKHTATNDPGCGGRGTNQLVRDLYPEIHTQYRSLFELSHRTRYDWDQLGQGAYQLAERQWRGIKRFCTGRNQGRPTIPTQAP